MAVFVTVGSTSFNELVHTVSSSDILNLLEKQGFKTVKFQIGNGSIVPEASSTSSINIEWFRYKDSIIEDVRNASLIIGHAGAGTILESLLEKKPLIAVLNETLMDNHQQELGNQLAKDGYLRHCKCDDLLSTLTEHFASEPLREFHSESSKFPLFLENVMGYR